MTKRICTVRECDYERANELQKLIEKRQKSLTNIKALDGNQMIEVGGAMVLYDLLYAYLETGFLSYKQAGNLLYPGELEHADGFFYGRNEVQFCLLRLDEKARDNERYAKTLLGTEICSLIDVLRLVLVSNDLDWADGLEPFYWLDVIIQNITQFLDI